ncbi:hypothetical protein NLU14_14590 [Marinobacter sp. 71-i]|uniref:Sel1 repeat family protein n=1 Tax=Marinobacter iranensis TaxID=2962607 RepID=A0ABT5YD37_9GAMM|nr:hypothetical protein [Marinobacter iranensis]MDF0751451.1 hypothetical protein [Marinobacter iranensis]
MKKIVNRSERDPYQREQQALFDQPYIDPLTKYLAEHQGDPARESVLQQVRQERDLRCNAVAGQYASEPATEAVLERYDAGYSYSCPEQVAAFEERVNRQASEPEAETAKVDPANDSGVSDQTLSDCYLLTTIRNYSAARKVCHEPANNGDVRSQANMAMIAHAFEDYTSAREWAEKAAPASGAAAFLLGQMYSTGRGVGQDLDQAVYWYNEAARQGHKEAQAALDRHLEDPPAGDT